MSYKKLVHVTTTDNCKRKIQFKFGYLLGNPSGECVAVGPWKNLISFFPRVGTCSLINIIDHFVNFCPHMFFKNLRLLSESESVWNVLCNSQDRLAMMTTPTNNIVHRVSSFASPFCGDPVVDGKPASPAPGFGPIDLYNRFFCNGRVGSDPCRFAARSAPVFTRRTVRQEKSHKNKSREKR